MNFVIVERWIGEFKTFCFFDNLNFIKLLSEISKLIAKISRQKETLEVNIYG